MKSGENSSVIVFIKENDNQLKCDVIKIAAPLENRPAGFPNRSDTNRAIQVQKMARGWKV